MMQMKFGKTYTVHLLPNAKAPLETAQFIKDGFSWPAFIFGPFWALYHRLWLLALVTLAFEVALLTVAEKMGLSEMSQSLLQLGFQACIACIADERLRAKARREGYITADIVMADSMLAAEQRFFDQAVA